MAASLAVLEERLQAVVEDVSAKNTAALADALQAMDPSLVVRITPHVATTFRSLIGHPLAKEDTVLAALSGLRILFRITAQASSLAAPPGSVKDNKPKQRPRTSPLDVPLHLALLADVMQGKKLRVSPSEEIAAEALHTYTDIVQRHAELARDLAKQPVLLGYVIYILLAQAENTDLQISTRSLALQAIRQTISLAAGAEPSALAFAVPGILSSITNIITKTSYIHTPLAVASVDIVSLLLAQLALATPLPSAPSCAPEVQGASDSPAQLLHASLARLRLSGADQHASNAGGDGGGGADRTSRGSESDPSGQGNDGAAPAKHGHVVRRKSSGAEAHRQGSLLDDTIWQGEEHQREKQRKRKAILNGNHASSPAEHGHATGTAGGHEINGSESDSTSLSSPSKQRLQVKLNKEWWTRAADNIVLRVSLLLKTLQQHQDARVRVACVLCSFALVRTCTPHMPGVVTPAMDSLMGGVTDSSEAVSNAATDAYIALTADAAADRRTATRERRDEAGTAVGSGAAAGADDDDVDARDDNSGTSGASDIQRVGAVEAETEAQEVRQERYLRQQQREVARRAQKAMQRLLQETLVRLPRCCRTGTDEDILFALRQLGGCLRLLTPTTETALRAGGGIKHFMGAMCTVFSFDVDEYDTLVADALASTEAGQGRTAPQGREGEGCRDRGSPQPGHAAATAATTTTTSAGATGSASTPRPPAAAAAVAAPQPRAEGVAGGGEAQQSERGLRKVYKYHRSDAVVTAAHDACRLMARHPSCLRDVFTHVLQHSQQQMHQQPALIHLLVSMLRHSTVHSNAQARTSTSRSRSLSNSGDNHSSSRSGVPSEGFPARANPATPFSIPPSDPSFWHTATTAYLHCSHAPPRATEPRPATGRVTDSGGDDVTARGGSGKQPRCGVGRGTGMAAERLYTLSMQPYWHALPVVNRDNAASTATATSTNSAAPVEPSLPQARLTAQELRQNVLAVCTVLEALACAAEALGGSFRTKLPEALYCLLTHVVSENVVVHQTALSSLDRIARVCECRSRFDLVGAAAPLLVGRISTFIRHLDLHPESPTALEALLRYAPPSSFSVVRNTAASVFLGLDGYHDAETTSTYLRLLFHFTKTLRRWHPALDAEHRKQHPAWRPEAEVEREARTRGNVAAVAAQQRNNDEQKNPALDDDELAAQVSEIMGRLGENPTQEQLLALREELGPALDTAFEAAKAFAEKAAKKQQQKTGSKGGDEDNGSKSEEAEDEEAGRVGARDEDGPPAPAYVDLAEQVTKRVLHFMPDPNPKMRQACLRTLEQAFLVLAPHTKQLLPLIHQSWAPLVARLDDRVLFVREAAVALLVVVCETAQDFVTRRMTTDAVPKLVALLEERGALLHGALSRFHSSVRLVSAVLRVLGRPWLGLGLSSFQLRPLVRACLPFLRSDLPLDVQTAAVDALRHLADIGSDVVWFGLISAWRRESDSTRIAATAATAAPSPLRRYPEPDARFADNVALLLHELETMEA